MKSGKANKKRHIRLDQRIQKADGILSRPNQTRQLENERTWGTLGAQPTHSTLCEFRCCLVPKKVNTSQVTTSVTTPRIVSHGARESDSSSSQPVPALSAPRPPLPTREEPSQTSRYPTASETPPMRKNKQKSHEISEPFLGLILSLCQRTNSAVSLSFSFSSIPDSSRAKIS